MELLNRRTQIRPKAERVNGKLIFSQTHRDLIEINVPTWIEEVAMVWPVLDAIVVILFPCDPLTQAYRIRRREILRHGRPRHLARGGPFRAPLKGDNEIHVPQLIHAVTQRRVKNPALAILERQ